ncbi:MAG: glutathione transferase [Cyanobacteria bacterium P01_A01_bin.37]
MSAFVTLIEKGVPFEVKTVNLAHAEQHQLAYTELSLTHRVPTLIHNGFQLSESSAISEYVEELFPPPTYAPVYPTNLQEKAIARQVQAWLRSDFLALREDRSTEVIFSQPTDAPLSDAARADADKLFEASDRLLTDTASTLFDEWCIADTDLALMLNRLVMNGDDVPEKLAAYARHQWQQSSVQQWVQQGNATM